MSRIPNPALWLGLAGVLPFYAVPIFIWIIGTADADGVSDTVAGLIYFMLVAQLSYAAIIVSFLGAIHWGLAMANMTIAGGRDDDGLPRPMRWAAEGERPPHYQLAVRQLMWSVVPALVGWGCLLALHLGRSTTVPLIGLAALFVATYLVDRVIVRADMAPGWLLELRRPLTWLAAGGLLLSWIVLQILQAI
ncbi:MAG: DUF3429 domain-containing protein [Azospirillaceae bacterium]